MAYFTRYEIEANARAVRCLLKHRWGCHCFERWKRSKHARRLRRMS